MNGLAYAIPVNVNLEVQVMIINDKVDIFCYSYYFTDKPFFKLDILYRVQNSVSLKKLLRED